jgi:hypothetical protein
LTKISRSCALNETHDARCRPTRRWSQPQQMFEGFAQQQRNAAAGGGARTSLVRKSAYARRSAPRAALSETTMISTTSMISTDGGRPWDRLFNRLHAFPRSARPWVESQARRGAREGAPTVRPRRCMESLGKAIPCGIRALTASRKQIATPQGVEKARVGRRSAFLRVILHRCRTLPRTLRRTLPPP